MKRPAVFVTILALSACGAAQTAEQAPKNSSSITATATPRGRIVTTDTQIEIIEGVRFAAGDAVIPASGAKMLDAIAATLTGNPDIRKVRVAAVGDSVELAQARADAVVAALIIRGVAGERLLAAAMIESDDRDYSDLEFEILERDESEPTEGGGSCGAR